MTLTGEASSIFGTDGTEGFLVSVGVDTVVFVVKIRTGISGAKDGEFSTNFEVGVLGARGPPLLPPRPPLPPPPRPDIRLQGGATVVSATMTGTLPQVAVCGPSQSGKKWISRALQKCFEPADTANELLMTLKTKYYTAHAELVMMNAEIVDLKRVHALIAVVDAKTHLVGDIDNVVDLLDDEECALKPEIRICIVNKCSGSYASYVPQHWLDWGVDNGFEMIAWGYGDDGISAGVERSGLLSAAAGEEYDADDDEVHGMVRLADSLRCNQWPEMEMLTPPMPSVTTQEVQAPVEAPTVKTGEPENEDDEANERELTRMLEQMDQIISRAKSVRDMSAGASDPERKRLAAETAIELWKMMMGDQDLYSDDEGEHALMN
jgi:hypothetical protein